ncbi:MAG: YceI family protein [Ferruginibacter sp.]
MKKILLSGFVFSILCCSVTAQKFFTKNGKLSFYSKATLENIKADNNQVLGVINTQTGELQFSLLIKGFHFEKALMEEHFNADYLQSDQYPKSTFKGKIADPSKVDFKKDGTYSITVTGDLMIHGVTKNITAPGTITVQSGKISASSKFPVTLSDYNVSIPSLVKDNISKTVDVTVSCNYDQQM